MTYSIKQQVIFDGSNMSAFGTLETAELTPVLQMDFIYWINTQTWVTTTANSATVDTNASRLRIQTGTNSAWSAIFNSRKAAKYRAWQWMMARFTTVFTTWVANSTQIIWVWNATDWLFFWYNGSTFWILHRNNWVDTWTAQASWNGNDKADWAGWSQFNWDKTKGNVCMIKYPYLGYWDIGFYVQDSVSWKWINVHTIRYANTSASTEFTNPSFSFYAQALNSGNTSNLTMYVWSVWLFISWIKWFIWNPKWWIDSTKTITTEACLLNIKNATTFNWVTNRWLMRLNSISVATNNNAWLTGIIRFKIWATIWGTPAYTPINGSTADNGTTITNGNAFGSYDTAWTTVTWGTYIYSVAISQNGSSIIDLTPFDLYVAPWEVLSITWQSSTSASFAVAVTWASDL